MNPFLRRRVSSACGAIAAVLALGGSHPASAASPSTVPVTAYTIGAPASSLAAGPDGSVWYGETSAATVGRVMPDGRVVEYPVPTEGCQSPCGISTVALGPDSAIWFAYTGNSATVGRIAASGAVTTFPLPGWTYRPQLAAGPGRTLWVLSAEQGMGIPVVDTSGSGTVLFPTGDFRLLQLGSQRTVLVRGPDGAMWFSAYDCGACQPAFGRVSPAGVVVGLPPGEPRSNNPGAWGDQVNDIAVGPDGNLWLAEQPAAGPNPDGAVGRLTVAGQLTQFPVPSAPASIAARADGALWFVDRTGTRIGRVTTTGDVSYYDPAAQLWSEGGVVLDTGGDLWTRVADQNRLLRLRLASAGPLPPAHAFQYPPDPGGGSNPLAAGPVATTPSSMASGAGGVPAWVVWTGATLLVLGVLLAILRLRPRWRHGRRRWTAFALGGAALAAVLALAMSAHAGSPSRDASPTGIVVVPTPSPTPSNRLVADRARFGLPTDAATIAQAAREDKGQMLGFPLTTAEQAEVTFEMGPLRDAVGAPAFRNYLAAHASTSAGLFYDGGARYRVVVVLFTRDVSTRAAELSKIFPYPNRLQVRPATYTVGQLNSLMSRVEGDRSILAADGVTVNGVGVDISNNAVDLTLSVAGPDQVAALHQRYGDVPLRLLVGGPPVPD